MNFDVDLRDPGDKFNIDLITQEEQTVWVMWISDDD
jgi:hypothetical protein